MTANYEKPMIEFEEFELNAAIATGCAQQVNLGPGGDGVHETCSDYDGAFSVSMQPGDHLDPMSLNFYEPDDNGKGSCSCYLTANVGTVFTS